ncbi:hypothetical protein IFM89_026964 [Coptis chinensis]|uniref:Uncharacterized protein n=1 Tax=Coptis chinensis TaxID=261450 RepID=A0A835LXD9_9MAGN|nr:hypothetical protein IFM89_026964 [Coptis chinensis]
MKKIWCFTEAQLKEKKSETYWEIARWNCVSEDDELFEFKMDEERGGVHRRYASPSLRDRGGQSLHTPSQTPTCNVPGYGTSAIVAMDRSATLPSGTPLSSGLVLSQAKSLGKGTERSLESVLHASKQKVRSIESKLRGLDISDKPLRSTSLDLGMECFNSTTYELTLHKLVIHHFLLLLLLQVISWIQYWQDSTASNISRVTSQSSGLITSDLISAQVQLPKIPASFPTVVACRLSLFHHILPRELLRDCRMGGTSKKILIRGSTDDI